MSNEHELLSKKQVMEQYRYPEHLLSADLRNDTIPYFTVDGRRATAVHTYNIRYLIPRYGVEKRIRELAEQKGGSK